MSQSQERKLAIPNEQTHQKFGDMINRDASELQWAKFIAGKPFAVWPPQQEYNLTRPDFESALKMLRESPPPAY